MNQPCKKVADFSEFHDPWLDYRQETDPFIQTDDQKQYYTESIPDISLEQFVVLDTVNLEEEDSSSIEHLEQIPSLEAIESESIHDPINDGICEFSASEIRIFDSRNEVNDRSDRRSQSSDSLNDSQSLETNCSNVAMPPQNEHVSSCSVYIFDNFIFIV